MTGILGAAGFWRLPIVPDIDAQAEKQARHQVHVAFGFHVNLYHCFRNDSNDENGFGKDIRIIRHILNVLDRFNEDGVRVGASWDFDNLFSLQNLLPEYAPDIIETIRKRVVRGEINRDVLIFIDVDADSDYWTGLDLSRPLDRLPNTRIPTSFPLKLIWSNLNTIIR